MDSPNPLSRPSDYQAPWQNLFLLSSIEAFKWTTNIPYNNVTESPWQGHHANIDWS